MSEILSNPSQINENAISRDEILAMRDHVDQHQQIYQQKAAGHEAAVLVRRSDGTISTGKLSNEAAFGDINEVNVGIDEQGNVLSKPVRKEALTDEYQAKLADELGTQALSGEVEVEDVDNSFDAMFGDDNENRTPEDAAVRTESDADRLARERRWADEKDASMKRIGRPEMN